eukprot:Gb_02365 [translate_table: standard]
MAMEIPTLRHPLHSLSQVKHLTKFITLAAIHLLFLFYFIHYRLFVSLQYPNLLWRLAVIREIFFGIVWVLDGVAKCFQSKTKAYPDRLYTGRIPKEAQMVFDELSGSVIADPNNHLGIVKVIYRGLDGLQGPFCVGRACVVRREALYGYKPDALLLGAEKLKDYMTRSLKRLESLKILDWQIWSGDEMIVLIT